MGEVVASIRDTRGVPTIEAWVKERGSVDTRDVAARFCMSIEDARKALNSLKRQGVLKSRRTAYYGYRDGGTILVWESV